MKKKFKVATLFVSLSLGFPSIIQAATIFNEDFSKHTHWRFERNEVPAECVNATLQAVGGYRSNSALGVSYNYNFQNPTCLNKPHYFTLTTDVNLVNPKTVQLKARANSNVQTHLRVIDSTGQTLQFKSYRTIESTSPQDWATLRFDLTQPQYFWGGQNTGKIVGNVKNISILVEAAPLTSPPIVSGNLAYDTLQINDSFDIAYTAADRKPSNMRYATASNQNLGTRLGIAHLILPNDLKNHNRNSLAFKRAKTLGFSFVRTDLFWQMVESNKHQYNFSEYNQLASAAAKENLGMLFILDYDNTNYDLRTDEGQQGFINFAVDATRTFKNQGNQIRFEIWNEPDIVNGTPNNQNNVWVGRGKAFGEFARKVIAAMKKVNPNVQVAIGGPSHMNFNYLNDIYSSQGSVGQATAVGIHGYRNEIPETLVTDAMHLQAILRERTGSQAPLWMTEWTYPHAHWPLPNPFDLPSSASFQERQANYNVRQVLTQLWLDLPVITLYSLVDTGFKSNNYNENQGFFALKTPSPSQLSDFDFKPSGWAIERLTRILREHRLIGAINDLPFGLNGLWLENKVNKFSATLLVWHESTQGKSTIRIPQSSYVSAQDALGRAFPLNIKDGYMNITIDEKKWSNLHFD